MKHLQACQRDHLPSFRNIFRVGVVDPSFVVLRQVILDVSQTWDELNQKPSQMVKLCGDKERVDFWGPSDI